MASNKKYFKIKLNVKQEFILKIYWTIMIIYYEYNKILQTNYIFTMAFIARL